MTGLSNKGAQEIDRKMIEDKGLPGIVLMEEAALGIYEALRRQYVLKDQRVTIIAGKGNNAGDGLALARILKNREIDVMVATLFEEGYSKEALIHLEVARKMGITVTPWNRELKIPDIIVDGIFGTGFKGNLEGVAEEAVRWVNQSGAKVVAIDIPSGYTEEKGRTGYLFVKADLTIALGYPKFVHLTSGDLKNVVLARLEFDRSLLSEINDEDKLLYIDGYEAALLLPLRKQESHKGTFGKVGILGGRREMAGAGCLAGKGALLSGCGLSTLWLESLEGVIGQIPELMLESWESFLNKELDVLVIGPGLGRHKTLDLELVLKSFNGRVLIDADGLYWLKMGWIKREWIKNDLVLTPHPKEMEILVPPLADRIGWVKKGALEYDCTVLLKGHRTLISDGRRTYVNLTGNSGMATAGSGDVLSGIIGSLMAQGMDALEGAVLGAFIHGRSGDLAARDLGETSLLAGDIAQYLPKAFNSVKNTIKEDSNVVRLY